MILSEEINMGTELIKKSIKRQHKKVVKKYSNRIFVDNFQEIIQDLENGIIKTTDIIEVNSTKCEFRVLEYNTAKHIRLLSYSSEYRLVKYKEYK